MKTDRSLAVCPDGDRLAALSRVAAAMAQTFESAEVLERGIEALIEATRARCGEAYQLGSGGLELEVVRDCRGLCPVQHQLAQLARTAAERGAPVREGLLVALPVLSADGVRAVFGLSLAGEVDSVGGCFLNAVSHLTALALDHAELVRELERREAQRIRLLRKWLIAQEEERRRVGQALHDEVGGILTGALLALRLAEREPSRLEELRKALGQALDEVRRLSRELRPSALDDLGLESALKRHFQEYRKRTGIQVHARLNAPPLDHATQAAIFRIVQESLTNTARHASAKNVRVVLEASGNVLRLEIADDGRGFNPQRVQTSLGIAGMRERAEQLDGRFELVSSPGKGTRILVEVPL